MLDINQHVLDNIKELAIKSHPKEFGGFLIGYYSDDMCRAIITDIIIPEIYISTRMSFQRSTDSLHALFENLYKEERKYYLGEWHTHPNGSSMFSQIDLKAMINISECPTVIITNPILLILAVNVNYISELSFYYYKNKQLLRYEQD